MPSTETIQATYEDDETFEDATVQDAATEEALKGINERMYERGSFGGGRPMVVLKVDELFRLVEGKY
jgi:hypothetical protein